MSDSRISGLYRQTLSERIHTLVERGFLELASAEHLLAGSALLPSVKAERMIENVIGVFGLPLGVAANFLVNNRDHIVPMVVEEPSIVAGVSGAANLIREGGGFLVTADDALLIGQIQVSEVGNVEDFVRHIEAEKEQLMEFANKLQPNLIARGGGLREIELFDHVLPNGRAIVVLHLLVDTRDAMGANLVNTMCEALAPQVEDIAGGTVNLRILSNLTDKAIVTAHAVVPLHALAKDLQSARLIRDAIVEANDFALVDPYRAVTHNKGIMNGVDALAIATGNDWRAIEAGVHAYAARDGRYRALTEWSVNSNGDLAGALTLPLKPGIVGGSLQSNPGAELGLALCGVQTATELAELMCATGLAQNLAALRALVSDGIQAGHMALHARSVATSASVPERVFDAVVEAMIESGEVKIWKAKEISADLVKHSATPIAINTNEVAIGQAAGKVILLGEHAVIYDRHALALPITNAVTAAIQEAKAGLRLVVREWGITEEWAIGSDAPGGAGAVVELIVNELDAASRGFDIGIRSRIPLGMGLGSSAAFAVAVIRGFDQLLKTGLDDHDVNCLALKCEQITHGTPSGIDNYVATYGQGILFNKKSNPVPIELREPLPLVIAASGNRGDTKAMVNGVRRRYDGEQALYANVFDGIDAITLAGVDALKAQDYDKLGANMNVCHGLLNAIGVSTSGLEKMVGIARRAGAVGAKLTGAGGGGSIIALCPDNAITVARELVDAGYQIVQIME